MTQTTFQLDPATGEFVEVIIKDVGTTPGSFAERPLRTHEDLDEWKSSDAAHDPPRARVAWTGTNAFNASVQLFLSTWHNPRPDIVIRSLDFASAGTGAAPFLVGVTAD